MKNRAQVAIRRNDRETQLLSSHFDQKKSEILKAQAAFALRRDTPEDREEQIKMEINDLAYQINLAGMKGEPESKIQALKDKKALLLSQIS